MTGLLGAAMLLALAGSPAPGSTPVPCLSTLQFAGLLFLDSDHPVAVAEVGAQVGVTEPDAAHCAVPAGHPVLRHAGHLSTDEVVYRDPSGVFELYRSAGPPGFPLGNLVKVLVVLLTLFVLLYAALPAIYTHLLQPPVAVGDTEGDGQPPSNA